MAKATGRPSSRRFIKEHDMSRLSYVDEWESKEASRQRELEEARARLTQMEKTMRWWSDCTANWREKWSKVRNERNMAREEVKTLRSKLEMAVKDANTYKHESQEMELQNEQLRKEIEKIHVVLLKHTGHFDQRIFSFLESSPQPRTSESDEQELCNNVEPSDTSSVQKDLTSYKNLYEPPSNIPSCSYTLPSRIIEEYVLQNVVPKHAVELYKESSNNLLDRNTSKLVANNSAMKKQQFLLKAYTQQQLKHKILELNRKLGEATKEISMEREENFSLHDTVHKLQDELKQLGEQYNELHNSRADVMTELFELKQCCQIGLNEAQVDLLDETIHEENIDRRLNELRTELEKLQNENAIEWNKREKLETEKISLERENKLLRLRIHDLQGKVDSRQPRPSVPTVDERMTKLEQELLLYNMVMLEMKQYQATLKKSLAEKTTELSHAMRRCEQYEAEVKLIRNRVEELKKELVVANDEIDVATSNVQKFKRMNEELVNQLVCMNVQLDHFRNCTSELCIADAEAEQIRKHSQAGNSEDSTKDITDLFHALTSEVD